jgi:nucleotidyltransferase/DNA polymerase involved in DNA repair
LHLRGRAVDLVRQHEVGEQRSLFRIELLGALVEHHRAHDVRGEQVGRELDTRECDAQALRHRLHRERLGESRHALEEDVTAGEQPDEQALDHQLLRHDALRDLLRDRLAQYRIAGLAGLGRFCRHFSAASAALRTTGSLSLL